MGDEESAEMFADMRKKYDVLKAMRDEYTVLGGGGSASSTTGS